MKYYLVEAYSLELRFEKNSYVVALTPLAAYELDKAGIKYSILEDYYDEAEFLKEEDAYFKDQLAWFDKFDNFLFAFIRKTATLLVIDKILEKIFNNFTFFH